MKGIILAAGKGKRLYPLTKAIPKPLLPVYDKPMIYYALDFMNHAGVKDVVLVVAENQKHIFESSLGDGAGFGVNITYRIQKDVNGTAGAVRQVQDFIDNEDILLYYADNILLGENLEALALKGREEASKGVCSVFALEVANPTDYGVLEIAEDETIISLEEKPKEPKSNYIAPGIYFYPLDLVSKLSQVELSTRGEYEMTDVNKMYLNEGRLKAIKLSRETLWFDAGDCDGLLDAANTVRDYKERYR